MQEELSVPHVLQFQTKLHQVSPGPGYMLDEETQNIISHPIMLAAPSAPTLPSALQTLSTTCVASANLPAQPSVGAPQEYARAANHVVVTVGPSGTRATDAPIVPSDVLQESPERNTITPAAAIVRERIIFPPCTWPHPYVRQSTAVSVNTASSDPGGTHVASSVNASNHQLAAESTVTLLLAGGVGITGTQAQPVQPPVSEYIHRLSILKQYTNYGLIQ